MRVLLCLLLAASVAPAGELKNLKGETVKGDIVSVTDKEVVVDSEGKKVATPLDQVLTISLTEEYVRLTPEDKYILVELTDGSQLKCASVQFKGKDIVLQTLQDQKVTLPLVKINWVLNEAHDPANMKAFKERVLAKKKAFDIVAIKREDVVQPFEGTIGEPDDKGENFKFVQKDGTERTVSTTKTLAFFFQRQADPGAKPVICRINDVHRNLLYASEVKKDPDGFSVVTSCGATLKYTNKQVARLDYSKGKQAYLSDLTPTAVKETSTEGRVDHYRRDENLEGNKIRLAGTQYDKGLAIHSTTELEYDLEGEYRELTAKVGIDDDVGGGDDPVVLKVYLDNVERLNWSISRKDKERDRTLQLNVKDVQKLKIVVTTGDFLDLGKHLTLAKPLVSK